MHIFVSNHMQKNSHAGWTSSRRLRRWGQGGLCKSHVYNSNIFSFREHRIYSHHHHKLESNVMAAPITSQVHSMHAITKVPKGREEKKERKKGAKEQKKQQDRGAGANVTWLQQINMSSLQLIWKRMNLWYLHLLFRNTSLSFTWTLCQKTIHTEVQNRYSDSRCCWLDLLQPAMFTKSSVHVIFYSYTKRIQV